MSERILIVEDEANIASFVTLYLQKAGYTVDRASTGERASRWPVAPAPSLIVLDLNLPDMDGLDVCRTLRAELATSPILMLTARDDDVDKIVGLEVGADDYLTKPFNPRELVARIRADPAPRHGAAAERAGRKEHGSISIDADRREVLRRRQRGRARAQGVRPLLGAARPPRHRADARPAARARLGLHVRGRHPDGRRPRAAAATQDRRAMSGRDRVGRRLQGRRHAAPVT